MIIVSANLKAIENFSLDAADEKSLSLELFVRKHMTRFDRSGAAFQISLEGTFTSNTRYVTADELKEIRDWINTALIAAEDTAVAA
ncbi:hypothetical protein ACTJJ7_20155 [Phyllobacterium sp. 22229]|uniref:hypothetical protein n=1 Tax=Phyllobacterium sp. 22229 TaxID=3453895 RepID=UPI003F86AE55